MTKRKATKRALLLSALSLLACFSMLVGSTFAWFTDSVSTAGNTIQSGKLQVDLVDENGVSLENKVLAFEDKDGNNLWEPGCTYNLQEVRVVNKGNLALQYQIAINGINGDAKLLEAIEWTITVDGNKTDIADLKGFLLPNETSKPIVLTGHMKENAGNEYQDLTVDGISISVFATQYTHEYDSEDNQYDTDAEYPLVATGTKAVGRKLLLPIQNNRLIVNLEVPENAENGAYKLVIPPESIDIADESIGFDMYLECNGKKVQPTPGVEYTGTITLPHPFVTVKSVYHNGKKIVPDHVIGETKVSFTVSDFSPFEIVYEDHTNDSFPLDYELENEDIRIRQGLFVGINPATIDNTLLGDDSQYIAVDYVKDGVKYYAVSERETTVFVSNNNTLTQLAKENGNYNVTYVQPGKLYNFFSSLSGNDFNTVYLLPGTYTEGTTLNISSSMDIIGLGDTNEVKVVKDYSTGSNQHLFNCAGKKTDYIQVTLHNLYLDATEDNYKKATDAWGRDNAAVQSIRKSKVKCYDLTVVKNANNSARYAFYVNAKNPWKGSDSTGDAEYCDAYMYVANCLVTVKGESQVVSTQNGVYPATTKWYFYHSGLTYNDTAYTKNSGNNKNVYMQANDWIWD